MTSAQPTADDKLIWDIPSGAVLQCMQDLVMDDSGDVAFESGQAYTVTSMHPISEPPFIRVTDCKGQSHRLEAPDVRKYFGR